MQFFSRLIAVALAAELSSVVAFRAKKNNADGASKTETKYIAGVPVYNYHLAYQGSRKAGEAAGLGLVELGQEGDAPLAEDWVVVLKPDASDSQIEGLCEKDPDHKRCAPAGHPSEGGVPFIEVHGSEGDLEELLEGHQDEVEFIEPDLETHVAPMEEDVPTSAIPAFPSPVGEEKNVSAQFTSSSSKSWGLGRVGAGRVSATGRGVHVYVLDTGIRTSHRDFGGRAVNTLEVTSSRPRECRGSTTCAHDRQGHGTHCAGTVAGGSYGIASGATVHAVKVLGDQGTGQNSWTLSALDWIITKGERPAVASMSLGSSGTSRAERIAIDRATNAGITVVVAAGNENDDACRYTPAFVPSAITVGSTDSRDRRSSFSCYGRCVDIWAPGSDITSAGHSYNSASATMSGTSMACPHVSGAAALLLGQNPSMTPSEVRAALLAGAEKNVISGLKRTDTNVFLSVSNLPLSGGRPVPVPVPVPAPTPAPRPAFGSCPSFTASPSPDSDGDCKCKSGYYCYSGSSRGCPWSRAGSNSVLFFSSTCRSCRCYSR